MRKEVEVKLTREVIKSWISCHLNLLKGLARLYEISIPEYICYPDDQALYLVRKIMKKTTSDEVIGNVIRNYTNIINYCCLLRNNIYIDKDLED